MRLHQFLRSCFNFIALVRYFTSVHYAAAHYGYACTCSDFVRFTGRPIYFYSRLTIMAIGVRGGDGVSDHPLS